MARMMRRAPNRGAPRSAPGTAGRRESSRRRRWWRWRPRGRAGDDDHAALHRLLEQLWVLDRVDAWAPRTKPDQPPLRPVEAPSGGSSPRRRAAGHHGRRAARRSGSRSPDPTGRPAPRYAVRLTSQSASIPKRRSAMSVEAGHRRSRRLSQRSGHTDDHVDGPAGQGRGGTGRNRRPRLCRCIRRS
jgi:hypothetical protein